MNTVIRIQVKPGGSKNEVLKLDDNSYLIRTSAKPIDGQANSAVIKLLAKYFDVPKSAIVIKNGATSRYKIVAINNYSDDPG